MTAAPHPCDGMTDEQIADWIAAVATAKNGAQGTAKQGRVRMRALSAIRFLRGQET